MVGKPVKDLASKIFRAGFHGSARGIRVPSVGPRSNKQEEDHNLEKMSFKGLDDGSSDAAGEGELCE